MASSSRSERQLGPAACRVCARREPRRRLATGQVDADVHGSVHGTTRDGDCLRGRVSTSSPTWPRCSRRRSSAWSRSARPLAVFVGRQIRAAGRAASDDAGWLVLIKDLEYLGTAIGLERVPRVVGKTERIGRPRPPADLDHDLRNFRSPGDLPAPTARIGTLAHVPARRVTSPASGRSWQPILVAIAGTASPSQLSVTIRVRSIQSAGACRALARLRIFLLSLSLSGGRARAQGCPHR
jgi:hypothetical protein